MGRTTFFAATAIAIVFLGVACASSDSNGVDNGSSGGNTIDTGTPPSPVEGGSGDDGGNVDSGPSDKIPPGQVTDLAGTPTTNTAVTLTWTAPGDDGTVGKVVGYQLHYSKTNIANEADFVAAKIATAPIPQAAGAKETANVTTLETETTYYFAVRAVDDGGNTGPLSNIAQVSTKARATMLVSEIATANTGTDGTDFVELVVTKAGWAQGIDVRQISGSLFTLGAFEVATGDRIVVHATGATLPAMAAQEDAAKSKTASTEQFAEATAWDVYSTTTSITGTDNLISVVDAGKVTDAVALSNRDGDAAAASMTAFANAKIDASWTFSVAAADGTNDCEIQREAVSLATANGTCGSFPTGSATGITLQRNGTTDTNGKADFYVAAQTRGLTNAAIPAPKALGGNATSTTSVDLVFSEELAPASVVAASFTVAGLNVTAAALTNENTVTLTTDAQVDGTTYVVAIANTVTNLQAVAVNPPSTPFCGYSALGAALTLSEVNYNLPAGADLIELAVTRGGSLGGFQLRANPSAVGASGTLLATLPAICAALGDVVVVHLTPGVDVGPQSEIAAKDEYPNATYAADYDGAWDVRGGNTGLSSTSNVVALRDPGGTYVEAVAFSDMSAVASTATYLGALTFVQQTVPLWIPADCGGVTPCTDATTPTAKGVAVDWRLVGATPSGDSVARHSGANDNTGWSVGASSFGAANP